MPEPVALLHAPDYDRELRRRIFKLLDASGIEPRSLNVLVKPNLLMAHELSCVNPQVVAAACQWLLERGARVRVGDSPAFGSCIYVSRAIGLAKALQPLGIRPENFGQGRVISLPAAGAPRLRVATLALESDLILSIARVKAHSQMRVTLSVKNCYGCIPGARKALGHARFGQNVERFADCVAALWASLPPVAGLCDGVVAMSGTGPRHGKPCTLGLIGASRFAPALDAAILEILQAENVPLAAALRRRGVNVAAIYPLERPGDFSANGFSAPEKLKEISFSPPVLARSMWRRAWALIRK